MCVLVAYWCLLNMYIIPMRRKNTLHKGVCGLCLRLWVDLVKQNAVERLDFNIPPSCILCKEAVTEIVSVGINRN